MNQEEFKIVMSSETDKAVSNLKKANDALDSVVSTTASATSTIKNLSGALDAEGNAADNAGKRWNQLGKFILDQTYIRKRMIQQVNQGIGGWKLEAKAIEDAGGATERAGNKNASTTRTLHDLSNVMIQSTTSGVGLERGLIRLVEAFDFTQKSAGGFQAGLKALGGAMIGPSGIILGISAVLSLSTELIKKYGSLTGALQALNPFLSVQAKAQAEVNAAMLENANSVSGELAQLDLLYKAAKDINIPLSERRRITDELIKQYPDTFNGLTAEAIATGKADKAYQALTKTLLAQAAVKAGNDVISQQGKEMLQLRLEADRLDKKLKDLQQNGNKGSLLFGKSVLDNSRDVADVQNDINRNKAEQNKLEEKAAAIQQQQLKIAEQFGAKAIGIAGATDVSKIASQLSNDLSKIDEKAQLTGESAKKVAQEKISLLTKAFEQIADIGGDKAKPALQDIGSQIAKLQPIADATTKKIKSVSDILSELNNSFVSIDAQAQAAGATFKDLGNDKIGALKKAISELIKIGIKPGDKLFSDLQKQIEDIQSFIKGNNFNITPPKIEIPVNIVPLPKLQITSLNGLEDKFRPILNDFTKDLNKMIEAALEGLTFNVADALGNAIVTGDFGNVLKVFASSVGSFMQDAGKALIATGIGLQAFRDSLKTLNGPQAIGAGVALVAAGAAFKAIVGKGIPAMATGGITNGPTLALIGDNPGGREAVVPSQDWREAFGGQNTNNAYIAETRISGGDLYLLVKQAAQEAGRF